MYASRKGIRSEKYTVKKRKQRIWVIVSVVFGCILFVLGFCRLTYISAFEIKDISIEGNKNTSAEEVTSIIREMTDGGYGHIISKNNIFLYPKGNIEEALPRKIPRIISATLTWKSLQGIHVDIVERKPAGLLCKGQRSDETASQGCYFADEDAIVFDSAPEFTPDVFIRYFFSDNRVFPKLSEVALDPKVFTDITSFVSEVKKMKLSVDSVVIGVSGDYELHISHQYDGSEGVIFLDDRQPFSKTLENLEVFLDDSRIKGSSDKYRPVEYLDMRYGNNLYYKFR